MCSLEWGRKRCYQGCLINQQTPSLDDSRPVLTLWDVPAHRGGARGRLRNTKGQAPVPTWFQRVSSQLYSVAAFHSSSLGANPFQLCRDTLTFPKKRTSIDPRGHQHLLLSPGDCPPLSAELQLSSTQHRIPSSIFTAAPARTAFLKHLKLKTGSEFLS